MGPAEAVLGYRCAEGESVENGEGTDFREELHASGEERKGREGITVGECSSCTQNQSFLRRFFLELNFSLFCNMYVAVLN